MKTVEENIIEKIIAELRRAEKLHPDYPEDMFRQIAIINEESGEATKAVLHYHYEGAGIQEVGKELIQTMINETYQKLQ